MLGEVWLSLDWPLVLCVQMADGETFERQSQGPNTQVWPLKVLHTSTQISIIKKIES